MRISVISSDLPVISSDLPVISSEVEKSQSHSVKSSVELKLFLRKNVEKVLSEPPRHYIIPMRVLCGIFVIVFAVACREPSVSEEFIPAPGPYTFALDFSDSLGRYDVALFTRIDSHEKTMRALGELPVTATWEAPSDGDEPSERFTESFFLPLEGARRSYFSRQVWRMYRTGVVPEVRGEWKLTVSLPDSVMVHGLRGMGVEVVKSKISE